MTCFTALLAICLFDLNAVGATLLGINQMFSYPILCLCVALLVIYRFTLYSNLGSAGRKWFLFMAAFIAIGAPIGLEGNALEVYGRLVEIRTLVSSALIVAASAVAARHIYISYGPRLVLTIVFLFSTLISCWVIVGARYPTLVHAKGSRAAESERSTGTYANPNAAGAAACVAAAVAFSALFVKGLRPVGLIALGAAAVAVMLTFSRSSILMLLVLSLAQLLISPGISRFAVFIVGGAIAAGIVGFIMQASSGSKLEKEQQRRLDTMAQLFQGGVSHETTGGRAQLAMNGIRAWLESPILGNGLGSQRRIDQFTLGPHNTYIKVLGEAGVVPAALFVYMLASFFVSGWRCTTPAVRTLVCGYALVLAMRCMVGHGILADREHNIMMGTCFGILAACAEIASRGGSMARRRRIPNSARPERPELVMA